METMTVNQITAALAVAVLTVVSLLMWALALVMSPPASDVPQWQWQPVQQQQPIVVTGTVPT